MAVIMIPVGKTPALVKNYPRRLEPQRNTTIRIPSIWNGGTAHFIGTSMVTLSGTIRDSLGVLLPNRSVRVFLNQGMDNFLGHCYTDSNGAFSISVPGSTSTQLCIVAQGEGGENCQVFSKVTG